VKSEERKAGGGEHDKIRQDAGKVKAVVKGKPEGRHGSYSPVPRKDDDGTMYNPFAEAFKKKK
jgi:hypothetical protein